MALIFSVGQVGHDYLLDDKLLSIYYGTLSISSLADGLLIRTWSMTRHTHTHCRQINNWTSRRQKGSWKENIRFACCLIRFSLPTQVDGDHIQLFSSLPIGWATTLFLLNIYQDITTIFNGMQVGITTWRRFRNSVVLSERKWNASRCLIVLCLLCCVFNNPKTHFSAAYIFKCFSLLSIEWKLLDCKFHCQLTN